MSQYAVLFDDADEPCFMYINTRNFYFFGLLVILHIKTKTHRNIFLLPSWDLQNCERIFDSELAMKAIVGSRSGNWEMLPSVPNVGWWPTSRSERFTPTPPLSDRLPQYPIIWGVNVCRYELLENGKPLSSARICTHRPDPIRTHWMRQGNWLNLISYTFHATVLYIYAI